MPDVAHLPGLGALRGLPGNGVLRFRNVPYAAPPVGSRRFEPPAPPEPWNGTRDSTEHGPIAPQPPSRLRLVMGDFAPRDQGEDCLTLTIATPGADGARRPVVVWLHGGAFLSGAGSLDWYDGAPLARSGNLVVVGVNYRLGPLGFLHHPGLADGMMGLHDIAASLRFVRTHAASFGGDPDNVTVMGQSAGGVAILRLLAMEGVDAPFRRAIIQSGTPRRGLAAAEAARRAERLMEAAEIDPGAADATERLRAVPAERLAVLQMQLAREMASFAGTDPAFPPVFDDFVSTESFCDRAAAGAAARGVDVLLGTTRDEMHAFFVADPAMADPDPAKVAAKFEELTGSADTMAAYRRRRPGGSLRDLLADMMSDDRFHHPILHLAERLAVRGRAPLLYRFDWAPPGSPWGACHCIELPFTFGTRPAWEAPMLAGGDAGQMDALSDTMMAAWTGFARTGDPALPGLPWPPYEPGARWTMRFGAETGCVGDLAARGLRTPAS